MLDMRRSKLRFVLWLIPTALVLLGAPPHPTLAGRSGPAPYGLAVQVVYGDETLGAESLREDVERWIFRAIASNGCFASMERVGASSTETPSDSDLLLRIRLTNLDVHESWDVSLAERTSPNNPDEEMATRVTATVAFDVEMDVLVLPEWVPMRSREYRHHQTYRPTTGEDPREAVRMLVLEDLARDARSFVCKGAKKIPREIGRARARGSD
jgi:hypothetical protein